MNQPRPESRISSLEQRASTLEALMIEMSQDTAEELKAIRQSIQSNFDELKQLLKDKASFAEMDEQFKAVATKNDVTKLEQRIDTMDSKLDQILSLLQQKPVE